MPDFILLMHTDAVRPISDWDAYFTRLRQAGAFEGGSSLGAGACFRKTSDAAPLSTSLGGYIRVIARDLEDAKRFLAGNPVYEAGGTVEIRELPRD